jgi:hypothetical protein
MESSSSWTATSRSVTEEFPNKLWNPKAYYVFLKEPSTDRYPESHAYSPYHPNLFLYDLS